MTETHAAPRQDTWADYVGTRRMNPSTLVHGFKSMLSLKRAIDGDKPEESAAMRFGQDYHRLILEPERFAASCVVMPDFKSHPENVTGTGKPSTSKTKWAEDKAKEFREANPNKIIVAQKYFDRMLKMLESLATHPGVASIIANSHTEVTVHGTIAHTECKGRLDLVWPGRAIVDLKGTTNISPSVFGRTAFNLHYPEKMAMYQRLWCEEHGGELLPVYIIAIETEGDFDRCLIPIRQEVLDHAFGRISGLMLRYENALKFDQWHGIDGGEDEVELMVPNWWMPKDGDEFV